MNLFVVGFLGLIAISTVQTRQILEQLPEDPESQESSPQSYEYKQVILYLTPSEVRALERNNVLQKTDNEYYSTYLNNQLTAQKQEDVRKTIEQSKAVKPIHESPEETTEKNQKLIDIPLFYPFQLIPLNNNNNNNNNNKEKDLEKENEKRWIEEIKKQLEEERENAKIENSWNPIPLKQNTQQIKTLLKNENKVKPTPDYPQRLQNAANNFDNKDVLKVQDFYRLQYELEQINKNNQAEDSSKRLSLKAQQPLFLYQSQQLKAIPAHIARAIRPTLQEETPDTLVDIEKHHHLYETKRIFDARKPLPLRDLYRE